ncbi:TIGR03643 family protein [Sulfurimonas aquatica]|uniref:TIGR03643 family protein n=1 Tax=Sulfurimonas aquatica TaxID=2672570 RepID=A0A975B100_9BACT|nr:TIGR03643 family protein [Sulfurimonas aquatica]QSZ42148.1 TIGR03643 family protein [Sulfurimonas aquatica]
MIFIPYKEQEFYRSLLTNNKLPVIYREPLDKVAMHESDLNRLIEMAWQDRVPFEIIQKQYGLSENQLKKKMRSLISHKAYKRWRKRVQGRATKHTSKLYHKPDRFQGPW